MNKIVLNLVVVVLSFSSLQEASAGRTYNKKIEDPAILDIPGIQKRPINQAEKNLLQELKIQQAIVNTKKYCLKKERHEKIAERWNQNNLPIRKNLFEMAEREVKVQNFIQENANLYPNMFRDIISDDDE